MVVLITTFGQVELAKKHFYGLRGYKQDPIKAHMWYKVS